MKPIVAESYTARLGTIFPKVKIAPTKFSIADYSGDMSSWNSFGKFIYELNKGRDVVPQQIAMEVKKLTRNATTDEEKVAIVYDYLQENTRYISIQLGIGGWQTFTSKYVAEKKYGDCKALTYYMKGMLREVGINSYPALVSAGSNFKKIDEDFTESSFNHIILCVPQEDKEDIWLECTSSYNPSNYLGDFTENRKVLMLTPEGGKLISTPNRNHEDHRRITNANVIIANNGAAKAVIQSQYYEREQADIRYYHHEGTQLDREQFLKKQLDISSFEIEKIDLKVYENEARADWNTNIILPKYYKKSGKRLFLYANLLNRISTIPSENNNDLPVERVFGYTHLDTIHYEIPAGYTLENIAHKDFLLETEFGKYEIKVIVDKSKITYIRRLEMYQYSLPKEKHSELRNFYSTIVKIDKMKMVLVISA